MISPARKKIELALFSRQLSLALASGMTIQSALEIMINSSSSLQAAGEKVLRSLLQGHRLSKALEAAPNTFPPIFRHMVAVGEETGGLSATLTLLSDWLEKEAEILARTSSALIYPLFVMLVIIIGSVGMSLTVLPSFLEILQEMDAPLPLPSRVLVATINIGLNPLSWLIGGILIACWIWFLREWLSSEEGTRAFERILRGTPLLQDLIRDASLARLFHSLHMTSAVGLDARRGLLYSSKASGSTVLAEDIKDLVTAVQSGATISEYLNMRPDLYPKNVVGLVRVGEESGHLVQTYKLLGQYYSQEVEYRIEVFTSLIEPIMIGFVSCCVGAVVLALLLPLYNILLTL